LPLIKGRADSSPESLAKLKTIFKENGTVTAGNSCAVSDGASLCLMASRAGAQRLGLKARARVEAVTVVGLDPLTMGLGPIPAIKNILHKMKMNVEDIDRFEINEAFASQVLACLRDLGIPLEKVNNNGGAIALGHPLGCTGTRLLTTLLHELERSKKEVGIAALCVGHGQGMAVMIKRVAGEF
jgi:acetyl-CoA acetyltransferase family protein